MRKIIKKTDSDIINEGMEKYTNFINEINSYKEEELLGDDNGISEKGILLLVAILFGTLLMCILLTFFVFKML